MTISVIRPDATRSGAANFTINGSASSTHAALNDSSDLTWLRKASSGTASIILNFATFTLSSTQAIKQVRLAARYQTTETDSKANVQLGVRKSGVNYFGPAYQIRGADSLATYNAPWYSSAPNGEAWSQSLLNQIMVQITDYKDAAARGYFYELQVDVDLVNAPTASVTSPSGSVTNTSKPDVAWAFTDSDGDAQAYYQVKVFSAAQYGVVGFDPTSATATWDSGEIGSADTSTSVGDYLANSTTYRAYVRVGKTLNGAPFWSAWAFSQFTVNLTPPTVPTASATFDSATNRVLVTGTGAAPTGYDSQTFEVQRSDDAGATWIGVRDAADLLPNSSFIAQVYDYEAPRGGTSRYRVRSVGVLADNEVASAWSSSASVSVTNDSRWWWKALTAPTLNTGGVAVLADVEEKVNETVGVFTPIGRTTPIVISGGLAGMQGAYEVVVSGSATWSAFEPLLEHAGTLLVQTPFGTQRYIRITDRSITLTGTPAAPRRNVGVQYVEVDGDL